MSDILEVLRAAANHPSNQHGPNAWLVESADTIAALTARVEELEKALFFVERWAVYKRYKPDGKNLTAEEAIGIIAFHPAIRDITKQYEAAGEIDVAAYERDRAAITQETRDDQA